MNKALLFPLQVSLCIAGDLYVSGNIVAQAQITTDGTVNTTVEQDGNVTEITGGNTRGGNLFHSFQDFSVPTGNEAFFNNANNISNIFSRVTGGNISNIDGAIRANGSANLFLINPAGIIFGENSRLDIGGSFYSSSASSILFEEGEFNTTDLENLPLLIVNAPIGLGFRDNPGKIVNRSVANDNLGLSVRAQNSLRFIGGDIEFDGGKVTATQGDIELGGLSEAGVVNINKNGSLTFPENTVRGDINFTNNATVAIRGTDGGNITLNGENIVFDSSNIANEIIPGGIGSDNNKIAIASNNLTLINGSSIFASTEGQGDAASIDIIADDTITIEGENSEGNISSIVSVVRPEALGNAGSVDIFAGNNVNFANGGSIFANTRGNGNAGSVNIFAGNNVTFEGEASSEADVGNLASGIVSVVLPDAEGDSGNLNITAKNVSFSKGARVDTSTEGKGDAGLITISASDRVTFDGQTTQGFVSSAISRVRETGEGNAGGIIITAENLRFSNGAGVSVNTKGLGNAGSIDLAVGDTITFDGIGETFGTASGIISEVGETGIGNAGNVNLKSDRLNIFNGAAVNASAKGQGNAGNINIEAKNVRLDRGQIGAENSFGEGGEIILTIEEALTLLNNSAITAEAFGEANGGNIGIDTDFIIAFESISLGDGNDIVANAEQGNGGNINITAKSLFGITDRPLNPNTNDINASSQVTGLDGTVTIRGIDVNSVQNAIELPQNPIEPEQITEQACATKQQVGNSNLTIVGTGGIPAEPGMPLNSLNISINGSVDPKSDIPQPIETSQGNIQPARGIKLSESGDIILTAYQTSNSGDRPISDSPNCQAQRS